MRIAFHYPSVAWGVIKEGSILAVNVSGYRNIETREKAQEDDYYHIGSNTKAFTAFLAGKLVDEGIIGWQTPFFDLFPELKEGSNPAYHPMTLQQLLSHRARLIAFAHEPEISTIIAEYEKTLKKELALKEKRYEFIRHILKKDPLPAYDKCDDCYSNAGFTAAGLMLEKVTGKSWEELMMKLSDDLDLDLHVGWPVEYCPEEPRGHINPVHWFLDIGKNPVPISDQLRMYHVFHQSLLLAAPSGNISIKTGKFLEFLGLYLEGVKGKDNYLKSETYRYMLSAYPGYTFGWWVNQKDGTVSFGHRGSHGTFYSYAGLFPGTNMGIVVMTNTYDESGLTDIIEEIRKTFER